MTRKERERQAKLRPAITKVIVALEKQYGEQVVSGTFDRHRAIRSAKRKLLRQRAEVNAKIAKLR